MEARLVLASCEHESVVQKPSKRVAATVPRGGMEDGVILTCPVCAGFLALGDRNGRHVASAAHYPHRDAGGTMVCLPLGRAEWGHLTVDDGQSRSPGGPRLTLVAAIARNS
jgi:hypothetical protein